MIAGKEKNWSGLWWGECGTDGFDISDSIWWRLPCPWVVTTQMLCPFVWLIYFANCLCFKFTWMNLCRVIPKALMPLEVCNCLVQPFLLFLFVYSAMSYMSMFSILQIFSFFERTGIASCYILLWSYVLALGNGFVQCKLNVIPQSLSFGLLDQRLLSPCEAYEGSTMVNL